MKKIICVEGRSNAGKDTFARKLSQDYGIDIVCSFTTRPMREYETDGLEHRFISKEKMAELRVGNDLIAYTINEKTGIEYCANDSCLTGDCMIYIINPNGVAWLKEHRPDIKLLRVFLDCEEQTLVIRGIARGDDREVLLKRLASEREEFNALKDNKDYDVYIDNSKDIYLNYNLINKFLEEK